MLDLEVADLTVKFGGATAVDRLTFRVPPGRITGLIGPNGAGKTTTFNACCGLVRPTEGTVRIGGQSVDTESPPERARRGLGRTFQRMELSPWRTVRENVSIGLEAMRAGHRPWHHLVCSADDAQRIAAAADAAIVQCGIAALGDTPVAQLSTGQRRLVELARAFCAGFPILLLDEPSSGLDVGETDDFGELVQRRVDESNTAVLLVEHDMRLVMSRCEYIYVIDFGRLIFEGTPDEVRSSSAVRAAYLGGEQ